MKNLTNNQRSMVRRKTKISHYPMAGVTECGWCAFEGDERHPPALVFYDDDDFMCLKHQAYCGRLCRNEAAAIVSPDDPLLGCRLAVSPSKLRVVPTHISPKYGLASQNILYLIAVMPEFDIRRIKVGHTTRVVADRLRAFRTSNPTAIVLGLWPTERHAERVALRILRGRIGRSEVCDNGLVNCNERSREASHFLEIGRWSCLKEESAGPHLNLL
jgi:hypothetical protein